MFEIDRLKKVGGFDNTDYGGDVFTYSPRADQIDTIILPDYFLSAFRRINAGDIILIQKSKDGLAILIVETSTSAGVTTSNQMPGLATPVTFIGAGALPSTAQVINVESTGIGDVMTLANGYEGQEILIIHEIAGGTAVITPANLNGYTTITLGAKGDSTTLKFLGTVWTNIANGGATTVVA